MQWPLYSPDENQYRSVLSTMSSFVGFDAYNIEDILFYNNIIYYTKILYQFIFIYR